MDHLFNKVRELANGKLFCQCGNSSWINFLYVEGGDDHIVAGCKKCGRTHQYKDGVWSENDRRPQAGTTEA